MNELFTIYTEYKGILLLIILTGSGLIAGPPLVVKEPRLLADQHSPVSIIYLLPVAKLTKEPGSQLLVLILKIDTAIN
jgi:hypothetical protein